LAESRERARAQIEAGLVTVGGAPATKPARMVAPGEAVVVHGPPPRFVSRGGDKLEAALEHFAVDVRGRRALDAGASTGGFTDCLLQRGVAEVLAVDVGYGQLHERVEADPRVRKLERVNVRTLDPAVVDGEVDLVVADLSFISLRIVVPALVGVAAAGAPLVVLVKPQFEAGRREASRGRGIITDPGVWRRVLEEVIAAFEEAGASIMGCMVSPITGSEGNVEFLLYARAPDSPPAEDSLTHELDLDAVIADARATGSP
jgi:23S rRNA (cytidine1920-2'-O)/16S rRNA (cytidine1409-2'-O)-methyltransferase